jgi:hypothetical protein
MMIEVGCEIIYIYQHYLFFSSSFQAMNDANLHLFFVDQTPGARPFRT